MKKLVPDVTSFLMTEAVVAVSVRKLTGRFFPAVKSHEKHIGC